MRINLIFESIYFIFFQRVPQTDGAPIARTNASAAKTGIAILLTVVVYAIVDIVEPIARKNVRQTITVKIARRNADVKTVENATMSLGPVAVLLDGKDHCTLFCDQLIIFIDLNVTLFIVPLIYLGVRSHAPLVSMEKNVYLSADVRMAELAMHRPENVTALPVGRLVIFFIN